MYQLLSLPLPADEPQLPPRCGDLLKSSDSNATSQLYAVFPQHIGCQTPSRQIDQFQKEKGMFEKKRNSASIHTDSDITIPAYSATTADAKLLGYKSSPKSTPSRKKRRVTFCKSTPPHSHLKNQCPQNNTKTQSLPYNNIVKNSTSCTSVSELWSSHDFVSDASTGELDLNVSPATFIKAILLQSKSTTGSLRGEDIISDASRRVKDESYYLPFIDQHLEAYTVDKVKAVQANDVDALRSLLESGYPMQASNRFGESLLHTSCRRGFTETVKFFINEGRVCPRVRDDMGRTPMHDVCWSSSAPNHDIMEMLIHTAPEMLLSKDKRGHSPFDYARREHWSNWVSFLNEHRQLILNCLVASSLESPYRVCNIGSKEVGAKDTDDTRADQ